MNNFEWNLRIIGFIICFVSGTEVYGCNMSYLCKTDTSRTFHLVRKNQKFSIIRYKLYLYNTCTPL